jgi:hypothetical protein
MQSGNLTCGCALNKNSDARGRALWRLALVRRPEGDKGFASIMRTVASAAIIVLSSS